MTFRWIVKFLGWLAILLTLELMNRTVHFQRSAIEKIKQNSPMELNSHLKLLFMENNVNRNKRHSKSLAFCPMEELIY